MKIGIITQPLQNNYGGLLQNYALQQILLKRGHSVITIDQDCKTLPMWIYALSVSKTLLMRILGSSTKRLMPLSQKENHWVGQNMRYFADKYIKRTHKCSSLKEMRDIANEMKFDALIVGSDQVWRPRYCKRIENSFLDFIENDKCKRISYAASFGVDKWEYTTTQTTLTKKLIQKFDAISVREKSAIELCRNYWGIDAQLMPDPTILLSPNEYISLIEAENEQPCPKGLLTYILDADENKSRIVKELSSRLNLPVFSVAKPEGRLEPSQTVTHWLRGFIDAQFVICDSFHGTVFSLLFNKPFVVLTNSSRGNDRFVSLLSEFNLEERLLTPGYFDKNIINKPINWDDVNVTISRLRTSGIDFIMKELEY